MFASVGYPDDNTEGWQCLYCGTIWMQPVKDGAPKQCDCKGRTAAVRAEPEYTAPGGLILRLQVWEHDESEDDE